MISFSKFSIISHFDPEKKTQSLTQKNYTRGKKKKKKKEGGGGATHLKCHLC